MTTHPPTVSDMPVLKLLNVESSYGPIKAIRGVSLQVRRGEVATVLGSNGAGKTTILKTISGIIDPRKGSIEFKGEDITARDPAHIVQQGLSHVPEGREVFPLLTVHDNLVMGAYTRKDRDGIARDMEAVYKYFPILKERATQDAGLLSGGQQQMLAISRAIMAAPDLILLDEPSLGLSPASIENAEPPFCWWNRTPTWRSMHRTTATCWRTDASSWKTPAPSCAKRTTSKSSISA